MAYALYAICMLNIMFYSECLHDCRNLQVHVFIYSVSASSAELWQVNTNSAMEDALVVITYLFYYAHNMDQYVLWCLLKEDDLS